jgi:hypothetical protein
MLAELLIGLALWTATSVLTAISLGHILQRGRAHRNRWYDRVADYRLSNVA